MKLGCFYFIFMQSFTLALSANSALLKNDIVETDSEFYDYIIVGAGSAGSILARKLSDRAESVLVIDVGEFRYDDPVILTPDWSSVANELSFGQRYAKNYPVPTGFLEALIYSEGQGSIGGSAAHNFLLAVRGTPSLYNAWATATGDLRWLYNNLLPKMKALETYTPNSTLANPAQRGFTGPISITEDPPLPTGAGSFYANLALASGATLSTDYNDPSLGTTVIGANQQFIAAGAGSRRSYSALEFLPMSGPGAVIDNQGNGLNGRKLKILTNARALKFKTEGGRAVSVEYFRTFGNQSQARVACLKDTGKLILSAGAIQTPKLLILSGVGPAAELQALGIKVVVDSPQVGKNLQNQYAVTAVVAADAPPGEAFFNGSPYTTSLPGQRRLQAVIGGSNGSGVLPIDGAILNPRSRGIVKVVSSNPLIDPELQMNFYTDGSFSTNGTDANLIVSFLKIVRDAVGVINMISPSPADYASDATLFAFAQENLEIEEHNVGSARMGTNIANSVVNRRLKVHGLENVYIGDTSVEPETVDGNTCFSAYYIGLELANILGYPTPPAL